MTGALELLTVYLGERLGLYQALSCWRSRRAGRPRREPSSGTSGNGWNTTPAGGDCTVDDPAAGPLDRRYRRRPGACLSSLTPAMSATRRSARSSAPHAGCRRWPRRSAAAVRAPAAVGAGGPPEFNRAVFLNLLAREWLPPSRTWTSGCAPEPPARVADLACGTGWSSIAMAQAYPLIASTVSTWTRTRSRRPGATPGSRPATGSRSPPPTRPALACRASTTW